MPGGVPYTGPNLGPLQPQGSPAGSKWGVVKTEPLAAATPPVAPAQPDAPPPSSGGWIAKAMEPITSYLPTQRKMAEEGMARMGEGVSELGTPGSRLSGGWKVVSGAADYVASPVNAALHTIVGKPLEENTGIPHEYSEFAAGLAIPGIGFSRTTQGQQAISAARNAGKVLEKIVSPETVDADARAAAGTIRELYGQAARHTAMTEHGVESGWKTVNAMPAADRLNFIDYIEGRSTKYGSKIKELPDDWTTTITPRRSHLMDPGTPHREVKINDANGRTIFDALLIPYRDGYAISPVDNRTLGENSIRGYGPALYSKLAEIAETEGKKLYTGGSESTSFSAKKLQDKLRSLGMLENEESALQGHVVAKVKKHVSPQRLPRDQQALADTLRTAFEQRMAKLQALPKHAQQGFVEDYFPHFWKDPQKAANTPMPQSTGAAGRQGSGASLKQRSVPTIADGIAAGLEPVTDHPLEATMRYITSMDRFIASEAVMQTAKNQGYVRFIRAKVMGASGHPESFKVPDGWMPLKGRGATDASGAQAYAPEGFARVYNNFISRGIAELDPALGTAYETARRGSNAITALELGMSGYHALTMAQEGIVNGLANAIKQLRTGHPIKAVKEVGKAYVAPVMGAVKGKKVQNVYLGTSPGSREMQKVVDLLTAAGGRAKGSAHAPDYNFSKTGSYWTAFKRGALRGQLAVDAQAMKARPITGTAQVAFRHIGRVIATVAQPLFEKYIPLIKNGAFYENMSQWLTAHPNASQAEQLNAARQVWDSVDNRFGEMVQDNIFMNKVMKQVGMLSLRSWSWSLGGVVRELGGAARDVARAPFKRPTGSGPQDIRWTQKMDYAIALPIVYGTLSAAYQYLKTGQAPEGIQDLMAPRTGGADATSGEPERLIMPGYMKDVFGFYEHPVQEATNKIGTAPKMAGELLSNRDWRDDPIFNPNDSAPQWLKQFWDYAVQNLGPISIRGAMQGQKEGSNLNKAETMLGVRTAPRYLTDPEGYADMMKSIHGRQWKNKERHDRKQQSLYGGGE
jgi:hypothetical protein